ncbi:MAG: NifB/NifX family molybdenum-iron cluster-binding protein [Deltaproteobacteria bacterium]|nr:NifB/NifX family molybdenum-iron cluster-binding protein [Deltaproteobacteria bacterium]
MKLAIPLYNGRVSPRFEYAPTLLLAMVEGTSILERNEVSLNGYDIFQRTALLKDLAVDTLICGTIEPFAARALDWRNIRVVPWIFGDVDAVLQQFLAGNLKPPLSPVNARPGCRRGRGGKRRRMCGKDENNRQG